MTKPALKIGPLPDRTPVKLTLLIDPAVAQLFRAIPVIDVDRNQARFETGREGDKVVRSIAHIERHV